VVTLGEFFKARPRGERQRLCATAEVSYETVRRIVRGGRVRDLEVARRISRATGGLVPVWALLQLRPSDLAGYAPGRAEAA